MNRPRLFTYLIGNPLSCVAILGGCGYLAYHWWMNQDTVSGFVPLLALFIGSTAIKANGEIKAYANWKREWDAMAGIGPQPSLVHNRFVRPVFTFAIWLGFAYWLTTNASAKDEELFQDLAFIFLVLNLVIVLAIIFRVGRWIFRRSRVARVTTERDYVVTGCLPVPKRSPRVIDILPSLPPYCQRLLESSRTDGPHQGHWN